MYRKDIDDDGKLYQRWVNKRVNAKKEKIYFNLTFEDFIFLVRDAGLKSSQLGYKGEKYVLARFGDKGGYTIDNCRFITQKENAAEKVVTKKARQASKKNIKKAFEAIENDPLKKQKVSEGIRKSDSYKERVRRAKFRKAIYDANKDYRYSDLHNSQFGTFWITNGTINQKWRLSKGELPKGFYRGRVNNWRTTK